MLFEYGGLCVGDDVMYNDPNKGWLPAKVISIHAPKDEKDPPKLDLVVFITGMHGAAYGVTYVEHGKDKAGKYTSRWLTFKQAREAFDDAEILRKKQEQNQLDALKQLEELNKPPSDEEPKDPPKDVEKPAAKHKAK